MKANRRIANRMEGARKSLFYFYAVPSNSEMYNWRLGVGQVRSNWRKYFSSMEAANSRRNLIKKWFMECRWVAGVEGGRVRTRVLTTFPIKNLLQLLPFRCLSGALSNPRFFSTFSSTFQRTSFALLCKAQKTALSHTKPRKQWNNKFPLFHSLFLRQATKNKTPLKSIFCVHSKRQAEQFLCSSVNATRGFARN